MKKAAELIKDTTRRERERVRERKRVREKKSALAKVNEDVQKEGKLKFFKHLVVAVS